MKFIDALLGRVRPAASKTEALFSITTAYTTLETKLDIFHADVAGICFKIIPSTTFERLRADLDELLTLTKRETATEYKMVKDSFGYLWIVLRDKDFEDIVTTMHLISNTLIENGFGEELLSSVFKFKKRDKIIYIIYNYKSGNFYPFIPITIPGDGRQRDEQYELKLGTLLRNELPVERDIEKWYPMWDIPL